MCSFSFFCKNTIGFFHPRTLLTFPGSVAPIPHVSTLSGLWQIFNGDMMCLLSGQKKQHFPALSYYSLKKREVEKIKARVQPSMCCDVRQLP